MPLVSFSYFFLLKDEIRQRCWTWNINFYKILFFIGLSVQSIQMYKFYIIELDLLKVVCKAVTDTIRASNNKQY
jgi:hypothetical protein